LRYKIIKKDFEILLAFFTAGYSAIKPKGGRPVSQTNVANVLPYGIATYERKNSSISAREAESQRKKRHSLAQQQEAVERIKAAISRYFLA
jgi:anti-sigma28 factor (negative regulator of flagellin synthesis)